MGRLDRGPGREDGVPIHNNHAGWFSHRQRPLAAAGLRRPAIDHSDAAMSSAVMFAMEQFSSGERSRSAIEYLSSKVLVFGALTTGIQLACRRHRQEATAGH